jgi:succinyl-diaminopimelate desuccinylase
MREIIDLTKKLIRFKSMPSKPEEIKNCIEFIEKYLINCKAEYSLFNHPRTPSIQVAPSGGFVPILLMTHIDVVDGPDELFNPVEKNQKLYGRC